MSGSRNFRKMSKVPFGQNKLRKKTLENTLWMTWDHLACHYLYRRGSHQTNVRKTSEKHQKNIRQTSDKHQTNIRKTSGNFAHRRRAIYNISMFIDPEHIDTFFALLGRSQLRSKLLFTRRFPFPLKLSHTHIERDSLVLCSESVRCFFIRQCVAVRVQFYTLWCSRGALVGSGYGTPYGGQDMAGGEKQCSRSRRSRSSRRSSRKDET